MENINVKENIEKCVTLKEIRQQGSMWQSTFDYFEANNNEIAAFMMRNLGKANLKVVITGAGSSAFVGNSVAQYLDSRSNALVLSIPTTDLISNPELYLNKEQPTLLISCARSGNSPESVAAVMKAEALVNDIEHIFLTCNSEGALAKCSDNTNKSLLVQLPDETNDEGFAMTSSFTSMLLSALLLFEIEKLNTVKPTIEFLAKRNDSIITVFEDELIRLSKVEIDRVVFLGSNVQKGLAEESSLKLLELTSGHLATSFDTCLGFRHGPKSIVNDRTMIFVYLSNNPEVRQYELDLLGELKRDNTGIIIAISESYDEQAEQNSNMFFYLDSNGQPPLEDMYLMLNYLTLTQLYSVMKSVRFGKNPDNPCPSGEVNRVVQGVTIY